MFNSTLSTSAILTILQAKDFEHLLSFLFQYFTFQTRFETIELHSHFVRLSLELMVLLLLHSF